MPTPWRFLVDPDGLLQLDFHRLFCAVPAAPSPAAVARAWARLAAEAEDSVRAADGTARARQAPRFGALRDAVAALVGAGARVQLVPDVPLDAPGVYAPEGGAVGADVLVARPWAWTVLADAAPPAPAYTAGADEVLAHAGPGRGWALRVRDLPPPPRLEAPPGPWRTVVATPALVVRVWLEADAGPPGCLAASLYRAGHLWEEEADAPSTWLAGHRLHVDVRAADKHADAVPPWPCAVDAAGAAAFGEELLRYAWAEEWGRCGVARALFGAARPWRAALRDAWRGDEDAQMAALGNARVCDEVSALLPAAALTRGVPAPPAVSLAGFAALRRMVPATGTRAADWQAGVLHEHDVAGFAVMPASRARWARLHALGAADACEACAHGALAGGARRTVVVPVDADARCVWLALASLFAHHLPDPTAEAPAWPAARDLLPGEQQLEAAQACAPGDWVKPYHVKLTADAVQLLCVPDAAAVPAEGALSLDAAAARLAGAATAEPRAEWLAAYRMRFPHAYRRLAQQGRTAAERVAACLREAQARRVTLEWTLEGLDAGRGLSSLGLGVAVALGLVCWAGARAQLYLSPAQGALVGCWVGDELVLVDPTQTHATFYDLAPRLNALAEAGEERKAQRGHVVEVLCKAQWQAAVVTGFDAADAPCVRMLRGDRRLTLGGAYVYRFAARTPNTDLDHVVASWAEDRHKQEQQRRNEERARHAA